MARISVEEHLQGVPARVRDAMLAERDALAPGAAAVTGRFYRILQARGEPLDAPSQAAFEETAASRSTLRTLLVVLARYAPGCNTAAARPLVRRFNAIAAQARRSRPRAGLPPSAPTDWPLSWRLLYPGLISAPISESSKRRHVASIRRCAALVPDLDAGEELGFLLAQALGAALSAQGVRDRTIAGYLDGLVALGKHGTGDPDALAGLRLLRDYHIERSTLQESLKVGRVTAFAERGGYAHIAETIAGLRKRAASRPAHDARAQLDRQTAALLAVVMNKPARTGDLARWRLGRELQRAPDGRWFLEFVQGKTGHDSAAGALWPEVGETLDELILAGHADRLVHMRYRELIGMSWLTHDHDPPPAPWPSARIKAALGIPAHDLRTLAADYLRRHDPDTAANLIATHLGHKTRKAGEAYRALAESDAASRDWARLRQAIRGGALEH